ncbi:carboxypeptidase regulatory-like domain-containing protein [Natronomonas marina]|jgi:PGF-CTERM protein|uniref:carboxypeptidase regulatory-like domain-containing protein n=1 Tax=Natronomonas marina TaxID=2961939 RepID=UPI0020C9FC72|nr:carboxypeptidase regulatory-like domain-containing protein [Natronomonas marina]
MSRLLRLLVVAMIVGWSFGSVGIAAAQSETTLTVSVVDSDGDPVADADVTATWDGGSTTETTAANGRAFVDVREGADVELNVTHPDYVRNHPLVVSDAAEEDVTVDVARKGRSTVVVRNADGQPLDGVAVEFQKGQFRIDARGETDEDGRFRTDTIEQGVYEVTAVKPGYFEREIETTVESDSRREIELERGTVQLEVTVVDDHFEDPRTIEEASVSIDDEEGEVAVVRTSGGTASLSVDVNNRYTVAVRKDGYLERDTTVTVRERDRSVEIATQRVPRLTLEPRNDRVVVGESTTVEVVNAYGEPVAGAAVLRNNETVGETDREGELVITIPAAGDQTLRATQGDLESERVVVEGVEPAETDPSGTSGTASTATGTESEGPGFGVVVTLVGLVGAALLARRR